MFKIISYTKTSGFFLAFLVLGIIIYTIIIQNISPITNSTSLIFPKPSPFKIDNAPSDSLKGKITSFSGKVGWESRTATEPAELTSPVTIQQGEKIVTDKDGKASLEFNNTCKLEIDPETEINTIQTLPANIVFQQNSGSATYIKTGTFPVSIRILHLLVQQNEGILIISLDKHKQIITIEVVKGNINTAFNNLNNVSRIATINEGEKYIFNDNTRNGIIEP